VLFSGYITHLLYGQDRMRERRSNWKENEMKMLEESGKKKP
jgi:hypothetical protein